MTATTKSKEYKSFQAKSLKDNCRGNIIATDSNHARLPVTPM